MDIDLHLLIVDDDERIRGLLQKFLIRNGYMASTARDAAQAEKLLASLRFDLIVLDVMMPGEDGFSFCHRLRAQDTTPILLLTAKGDAEDRIKGLEAGADDYLPKPFEPKELLLRINAILRRMPQQDAKAETPSILTLGPVRYDNDRGELWHGPDPVRLTATETALMRIFAARPHDTIPRADLADLINRDKGSLIDQAQDRAVDVQITRLRRKLEVDPKRPRYLQTVRGVGYMLAPD
jgi:two-component system phosphate regulon response regulator OmpR